MQLVSLVVFVLFAVQGQGLHESSGWVSILFASADRCEFIKDRVNIVVHPPT